MTIQELSVIAGAQIVIRNRPEPSNDDLAWYACLEGVEEMDHGMLIGRVGNGPTPNAALTEYVFCIRGKKMCANAGTDRRREFIVPISLVVGFEGRMD